MIALGIFQPRGARSSLKKTAKASTNTSEIGILLQTGTFRIIKSATNGPDGSRAERIVFVRGRAIGEWLYSTVAGIDPDPKSPGYKHIIFRPTPGEGLTWAKGSLQTRYGLTACSWKRKGKRLSGTVTVPPNTKDTVILPGQKQKKVSAGTHEFSALYRLANRL